MECTAATRLLEKYTEALHAFHTVREPHAGMAADDPDYSRASRDREEAFAELARSRGLYWKHVQMHGCRGSLSPRSRQNEIYASLQTDLLEARRRFDGASVEYRRLNRIAKDALGTTDGTFALQKARGVHSTAHEAYLTALQRFTDFVTTGATPEDARK
jgi:hypothetical protein